MHPAGKGTKEKDQNFPQLTQGLSSFMGITAPRAAPSKVLGYQL